MPHLTAKRLIVQQVVPIGVAILVVGEALAKAHEHKAIRKTNSGAHKNFGRSCIRGPAMGCRKACKFAINYNVVILSAHADRTRRNLASRMALPNCFLCVAARSHGEARETRSRGGDEL